MSSELGLDPELCAKFIDEHLKFKPILKELFEKTVVDSKEYVLESVRSQVRKWKESRDTSRTPYLLFEQDKIGSMAWLYSELKDDFDEIGTRILTGDIDLNGIELVICDDFSMSGSHVAGTFEYWAYEKTKDYLETDITLSVLCHITTESSRGLIMSFEGQEPYAGLHDINIYYSESISQFVPAQGGRKLAKEFILEFCPDTEDTSYAYLTTYKIPNQWASFPLIYEHVARISRSFMKQVPDPFELAGISRE